MPLGVMPDVEFGPGEAELQSGDLLLLYTDGITEAFNPAGETFGADRLAQALREHASKGAAAVCDAIVERTLDFSSGEPPHDDQTLIVLERLWTSGSPSAAQNTG